MTNPTSSDKQNPQQIIARLEAAEAGGREFDAAIGAACRVLPDSRESWMEHEDWGFAPYSEYKLGQVALTHFDGRVGAHWAAPHFTTSIDAALTLVPEGWIWTLAMVGGRAEARLLAGDTISKCELAYAPTPALALCIAALKARQPPPENASPNRTEESAADDRDWKADYWQKLDDAIKLSGQLEATSEALAKALDDKDERDKTIAHLAEAIARYSR